jgi:F-type H+-transporting ATPase subunit delta
MQPHQEQPESELWADAAVEHIAAVYARALLGAAERAGQTAAVMEQFDSLLADVLDKFPRLDAVLVSWLVPQEERLKILDRVFGATMSRMLLNFLKVLTRHGRLDVLRAVHRAAHELWDEARGRHRVRLLTAAPVDAGLLSALTDALRQTLGGEPVVEPVVQPNLIGGAVIRIGDTVYDGSVATQLENLRVQMIDRSIHEIQSRRDRFRHST